MIAVGFQTRASTVGIGEVGKSWTSPAADSLFQPIYTLNRSAMPTTVPHPPSHPTRPFRSSLWVAATRAPTSRPAPATSQPSATPAGRRGRPRVSSAAIHQTIHQTAPGAKALDCRSQARGCGRHPKACIVCNERFYDCVPATGSQVPLAPKFPLT